MHALTAAAPTAGDPARHILETQKKSWDTFSPGWAKWDDFTRRFLDHQRAAGMFRCAAPETVPALLAAAGLAGAEPVLSAGTYVVVARK